MQKRTLAFPFLLLCILATFVTGAGTAASSQEKYLGFLDWTGSQPTLTVERGPRAKTKLVIFSTKPELLSPYQGKRIYVSISGMPAPCPKAVRGSHCFKAEAISPELYDPLQTLKAR